MHKPHKARVARPARLIPFLTSHTATYLTTKMMVDATVTGSDRSSKSEGLQLSAHTRDDAALKMWQETVPKVLWNYCEE